jgi:pimeloyl-ACP methyl ester carboxylesterase
MGQITSRMRDLIVSRLAFHPPDTSYSASDVVFTHTDAGDKIAMWMSNAPGCNASARQYNSDRPLVLFSHGNAEDIGGVSEYCCWLSERINCNVLTYDYVNYGQSARSASNEVNLRKAAVAVFEYVQAMLGPDKLILMGKSIGTAPTMWLAAHHRGHLGVVLVSPLASGVRTLGLTGLFPGFLLHHMDDIFCNNLACAKKVNCPVLILHGNQDDIIPVINAHDLRDFLEVRCKAVFFGTDDDPTGHNDIEAKHGEMFVHEINRFIVDTQAAEPYY